MKILGASKHDLGVSLVEFSIVGAIFMLLLGGLLDLSVLMQNYSYISYQFTRIADETAQALPEDLAFPCTPNLNQAKETLEQMFPGITVNARRVQETPELISLESDWVPQCFFCMAWPQQLSVPIRATAMLEDQCP